MKKILVVDDELDILYVVRVVLEKQGYILSGLSEAKQILPTIDDFKPDMVLLDLRMPELDYVTICNKIKNLPQPPILVLFSATNDLGKYLEVCEADGILAKPFDINEMCLKIESLFRNFKMYKVPETLK